MKQSYRIEYERMVHESGSKDYELIQIVNQATSRCLLIRRWGGVGRAHQEKIQRFDHTAGMASYVRKVKTDKLAASSGGKHGYKLAHMECLIKVSQDEEAITASLIRHDVKVGNSEYVKFMGLDEQVTSDEVEVVAGVVVASYADLSIDLPEHYGTW